MIPGDSRFDGAGLAVVCFTLTLTLQTLQSMKTDNYLIVTVILRACHFNTINNLGDRDLNLNHHA